MDYQIVHAIEGRVRIRIAQLASNPEIANKLQGLLESLHFVTNVRINLLAESIVITYKPKLISHDAFLTQLAKVVAQVSPPSTAPPKSQPTSAPSASPASSPQPASSATPSSSPQSGNIPKAPAAAQFSSAPESSAPESSAPESIDLADPWEDATDAKEKTEDCAAASSIEPANPSFQDNGAVKPHSVSSDAFSTEEAGTEVILADTAYSASMLAERLGVTVQAVTRRRSKPDFDQWSQTQDPAGIAWRYETGSKSFYPIHPPR